jgi:hypothetical protein
MGLPLERNTDYAPESPFRSMDANDMQDAIVAGAHGELVTVVHPFAAALGANASKNGAGYVAFSGAGDAHVVEAFRTGTRITGVLVRVYGNGVTVFAVNAWVMNASNVLANIGPGAAAVTSTPGAAWADLVVDVTDTTLGAGESFWLSVETSGGGARLGNTSITHHKLF